MLKAELCHHLVALLLSLIHPALAVLFAEQACKLFDVVAVIAGRSGLGAKHGITLSNGIGVIDSDYRGEISVTLTNHSDTPFTVNDGDRIAQMMFLPVMCAEFIAADELDETERGAGGFGSTGTK